MRSLYAAYAHIHAYLLSTTTKNCWFWSWTCNLSWYHHELHYMHTFNIGCGIVVLTKTCVYCFIDPDGLTNSKMDNLLQVKITYQTKIKILNSYYQHLNVQLWSRILLANELTRTCHKRILLYWNEKSQRRAKQWNMLLECWSLLFCSAYNHIMDTKNCNLILEIYNISPENMTSSCLVSTKQLKSFIQYQLYTQHILFRQFRTSATYVWTFEWLLSWRKM